MILARRRRAAPRDLVGRATVRRSFTREPAPRPARPMDPEALAARPANLPTRPLVVTHPGRTTLRLRFAPLVPVARRRATGGSARIGSRPRVDHDARRRTTQSSLAASELPTPCREVRDRTARLEPDAPRPLRRHDPRTLPQLEQDADELAARVAGYSRPPPAHWAGKLHDVREHPCGIGSAGLRPRDRAAPSPALSSVASPCGNRSAPTLPARPWPATARTPVMRPAGRRRRAPVIRCRGV